MFRYFKRRIKKSSIRNDLTVMLIQSRNIFFSGERADNSKDTIAPCFGSSTDGKRESETKCEFHELTRILEHERRSRWRGGREKGEPRCNFAFDFEKEGGF